MTTFYGIVLALGVCGTFLAALLETGSTTTAKQAQNEPTELDAELEEHIDSFN